MIFNLQFYENHKSDESEIYSTPESDQSEEPV